MFKRSACYLLLVGLYALASAFLYLDGLSAFYLKDEELDYLVLLIAGAVLVIMPALALFLIGMARHEPWRNAVIPRYRLVAALACVGLVVQAIPTLKHGYYKYHYALSEQGAWYGGVESFNVLAINGRSFCELSTKTAVHFADVNDDGFADMVPDRSAAMPYVPASDEFENCPFLGF